MGEKIEIATLEKRKQILDILRCQSLDNLLTTVQSMQNLHIESRVAIILKSITFNAQNLNTLNISRWNGFFKNYPSPYQAASARELENIIEKSLSAATQLDVSILDVESKTFQTLIPSLNDLILRLIKEASTKKFALKMSPNNFALECARYLTKSGLRIKIEDIFPEPKLKLL